MRLAPHERRQIERLAQAHGTTMKEAILKAVRTLLAETKRQRSSLQFARKVLST